MNRYIFGLVLVQTLPYLNIIPWDPNSRWWLHEPLLAALCLPVLPVLWRSKIIPKGYWIFVAWTALTILYTPQQPKVAIGRFLPAILLLAGVCYLVRQIKTADDVHRLLDGFLRACSVLVTMRESPAWRIPTTMTLVIRIPPGRELEIKSAFQSAP
jgi:hypothetical protein